MSLWVLDTDTVTHLHRGRTTVCGRVKAKDPGQLAITIVNVEEMLSGWYALIRQAKNDEQLVRAYEALQEAVRFAGQVQVLPFTAECAIQYRKLRATYRRAGAKDLKIAAITLVHRGVLVTCNTGDFRSISGLDIEDWSKE